MTKEDKELLFKDLCGRLPYGVKCQIDTGDADVYVDTLANITIDGCACFVETIDTEDVLEYGDIKPLLFPMSSMTDEQKEELRLEHEKDLKSMAICMKKCSEGDTSLRGKNILYHAVDWCNKNHFDYRGLIPMGLAEDATGKNIY